MAQRPLLLPILALLLAACAAAKAHARSLKIVGGQAADSAEQFADFNYVAQVGILQPAAPNATTPAPFEARLPHCVGAVLSPEHVLTAASCLLLLSEPNFLGQQTVTQLPPEAIFVLTGTAEAIPSPSAEQERGQAPPSPLPLDGTLSTVATVTVHPNFTLDGVSHDLALLTLAAPLDLLSPNSTTRSIAVSKNNSWERPGADAWVAGYPPPRNGTAGVHVNASFADDETPGTLHFAAIDILTEPGGDCPGWHGSIYDSDELVCAGGCLGVGPCLGDQGAPLAVLGNEGEPVLVGLMAAMSAEDVCYSSAPSLYTRLSEQEVLWVILETGSLSNVKLGTPCDALLDAGAQCQKGATPPWAADKPSPEACLAAPITPTGGPTNSSSVVPLWNGGQEPGVDIFSNCPGEVVLSESAVPNGDPGATPPIGHFGLRVLTEGCFVDIVYQDGPFPPCAELRFWIRPTVWDPARLHVGLGEFGPDGLLQGYLDSTTFDSGRVLVIDGANPPAANEWSHLSLLINNTEGTGNSVFIFAAPDEAGTTWPPPAAMLFELDGVEVLNNVTNCSSVTTPSPAPSGSAPPDNQSVPLPPDGGI